MTIFVGDLPFEATDADVKKLFEEFGAVASAVIVMEKEKKAPKSRGFGFVEMADEQQARAAIAALNGREFMGRALNVTQARPRTEPRAKPRAKPHRESRAEGEAEKKKPWYDPVYNRPGTYRGGRRTRSFVKKQMLAGAPVEFKPRRGPKDNPGRWRKEKVQPKSWAKGPGEHKPGEEARPWKKPAGDAKPWKKPEGESKPWKKKPAGDAKPWKKPAGESTPRRKPARFKR